MTKRKSLSTKTRVGIFQRHNGICDICHGKITVGDLWDVSHRIPLELGGADDETNWFPAHRKCHKETTYKEDIPKIAKAKRLEAKNTGAFRKRSNWPCGKSSGLKRKLDGTVVKR